MRKLDARQEQGWRSKFKRVLIGVAAWSLVAGAGSEALAAGSTLQQDFRLWSPVYLTVPLSNSFLGFAEVNPRFGDDVSNLNQLILRTALGYKLNDRWSVWQGYAWSTVYHDSADRPIFIGEHRSYQQLSYKETFPFLEAFPSIKINSRSRLEERWIEHADGTSVRARTMLRVDIPLPKITDTAFVTYDEIFVNLNGISGGPEAGFDQNRFFVGINHLFLKQFSVDLGYQMQIINSRKEEMVNQMNNMILVQFWINL